MTTVPHGSIHLIEEKVFAHLGEEEVNKNTIRWVVDTGATNHMTGERNAFAELDVNIRNLVQFDDGFVVRIEGCSTIIFWCKNGTSNLHWYLLHSQTQDEYY
jgi:hypothetical protein